jgi:hypothetical protein
MDNLTSYEPYHRNYGASRETGDNAFTGMGIKLWRWTSQTPEVAYLEAVLLNKYKSFNECKSPREIKQGKQ